VNRLWETFSALTAIDSLPFKEKAMCDELKARLTELGADVYSDGAGKKIGGDCGNLYGYVSGAADAEPLLFSAHMDTVEPGRGKKAVLAGNVITSAGDTVLGADDAAGLTIILEAVTRLKESGAVHRPIELLFTVAEELYGLGSANADYSRIKSKEAYTLDLSGEIGEAANAAPAILSFEATIRGKAAHAGFAPKDGVNAAMAAVNAAARIPVGEVEPGVAVNIGTIEGGTANNIVPERCRITGEIRGLSQKAAEARLRDIEIIFEEEAKKVGANVTVEHTPYISAYETPLTAKVAERFAKACEKVGVKPDIHPTMGGSDQNNYASFGIEGIVVACSMHNVHSVSEFCRLDELEKCTELVLALITL